MHLLDLEPQDYLYYPKMGTFFAANMYWDKIIDLYNQYSNNSHFDISSRTYRIKNGHNAIDATGYKKEELLDGHTYYVVPVYQREYSWDEEQISRFVRDIFSGFWNVNEERTEVYLKEEPLFIGTMQLSQKRHLSETESEQDIIDGQQRVSTLLCLFKYLSLKYPGDFAKHSIPLNWLETRVNNEKEQGFLNAFLSVNDLGEIKESSENKYIRGCALISNYFDEALGEHIERLFDVNRFINYLLTSIYFVVVETVAGLSKTIQIFNTINTGVNFLGYRYDMNVMDFYYGYYDWVGGNKPMHIVIHARPEGKVYLWDAYKDGDRTFTLANANMHTYVEEQ